MKQRTVCEFDIADMLPIGLTLVVAGIGIAYGVSVLGDVSEDACDGSLESYDLNTCFRCTTAHPNYYTGLSICSNETVGSATSANISASVGGDAQFNATNNASIGTAKIPEKMPMVATVIIAAIIIGILVRYLMVRF